MFASRSCGAPPASLTPPSRSRRNTLKYNGRRCPLDPEPAYVVGLGAGRIGDEGTADTIDGASENVDDIAGSRCRAGVKESESACASHADRDCGALC